MAGDHPAIMLLLGTGGGFHLSGGSLFFSREQYFLKLFLFQDKLEVEFFHIFKSRGGLQKVAGSLDSLLPNSRANIAIAFLPVSGSSGGHDPPVHELLP